MGLDPKFEGFMGRIFIDVMLDTVFTIPFLFQFLMAELNTFYLKFVLWIPPPHFLCLIRLVFLLLTGAVAIRETYQYMDDQ